MQPLYTSMYSLLLYWLVHSFLRDNVRRRPFQQFPLAMANAN